VRCHDSDQHPGRFLSIAAASQDRSRAMIFRRGGAETKPAANLFANSKPILDERQCQLRTSGYI